MDLENNSKIAKGESGPQRCRWKVNCVLSALSSFGQSSSCEGYDWNTGMEKIDLPDKIVMAELRWDCV
jgi:hypothetical protein